MHFQHVSYAVVFLIVGLESIGIPLPGETALVTAAVYAGTTHTVNIFLVIFCAILGAILGDNVGYWIGRQGGFFLLRKYGKYIRINESKLKLGQYLFTTYGGRVVFFGRFFAVLRVFAAFLAGTNTMPWKRFLVANAAGAIMWALFYGYLGYTFGKDIHSLDFPLKIITFGIGVVLFVGVGLFLKNNEKRLESEAVKAMPGPIEKYRKK